MTRTTLKHLNSLAAHLNRALGRPVTYRDEPSQQTNVGYFYIEEGFQCFRLNEVANECGGVNSLLYGNTKRELEGKMLAFDMGMRVAKAQIRQQVINEVNRCPEEVSDGENLDAILDSLGIRSEDLYAR